MPIAGQNQGSGWSPYGYAAAGAVAAVSVERVMATEKRSKWALGIGAAALVSGAYQSSSLNSLAATSLANANSINAQAIGTQTAATTTVAVSEITALKNSLVTAHSNIAQLSYLASGGWGAASNTQPPVVTPSGATAGTAVAVPATNNNGIVLLLGLGIIGFLAMG